MSSWIRVIAAARTSVCRVAEEVHAVIDYYSTPILTARETARYLGMPESTLDVWLRVRGEESLVHTVRPNRRGWPRVPFVGVIEAYVLRALRDLKLPMDEIRTAAEFVRREFDDPYALAHRRIVTDGAALFVRLADQSYVHPLDRQIAIAEVLEQHLRRIEWGADGNATRLHLVDFPAAADVIIDPRFGWGAPVLGRSKVKVDDLVALWRSGERLAGIADEYGLAVDVVEDVLRRAA
ncbi:MAG: hypothetical protein ACRCYX_09710 [Dermatophilaceae bacterium]